MHADGSGRHALTNQTNQNTIWTDSAPSFSPDGASVVYSHWTGDAPRLLGSLGPQYGGAGLAWSPDGSRLALTACDRSQICDVWTVSRTGAGLRRMTYGLGAISRLSWAG